MATRRRTPSQPRNPSAHAALGLLPVAISFLGGGHAPPTTVPRPAPPAISTTVPAAGCGPHCGTERWPIKTMSDAGAALVSLTPVPQTVSALISSPSPSASSNDLRLNDMEKQAFTVRARLVGFKEELEGSKGDHDLHIVIQDLVTKDTMIVEIPDPLCDGVCNSVQRASILQARTDFLAAFPRNPAGPQFVVVDDPQPVVEVTGVGLFDFFHGQTGVAKNCIELHPVLGIRFPAPGTFGAKVDRGREPPKTDKSEHDCIPE